MKIAVLGGTGRQGKGLAMRLSRAGHQVWVGSRTAEKARTAVDAMDEAMGGASGITPAENAEAARQAEVVFLTVPHPHEYGTVEALKDVLKGKTLVDVSVPLTNYKPPEADLPEAGSAAEGVQRIAGGGAPVVAAFKTTSSVALQRIEQTPEADELVCGDDAEAKQLVLGLVSDIGARGFDAGPLRNARAMELMTAVLIQLDQTYKKRDIGIKLSGV